MGIRDALRSLRNGNKKAGAPNEADEMDAPEPTWFQPRFDGAYETDDVADGRSPLSLRFLPGARVIESGGTAPAGPADQDPCRGEYTGAGRFNVQRRFQRIVSYAVLEMEDGEVQDRPGFLARRIDGADRSTREMHFTFRPDVGVQD